MKESAMRHQIFSVFLIFIFSFGLMNCSTGYDGQLDIAIMNGTVYDGSGEEPYKADIGIKDGNIAYIGKIKPNAEKVIDAEGLYISPGFIDMHNHAFFTVDDEILAFIGEDVNLDELRAVKNFLYQGVTTLISGNCGAGDCTIDGMFTEVEEKGIGPNLLQLIGHGTIRGKVMGMADRAPTEEEMEQMKAMVREGMEGGAIGLSTGLFYAPGCYADTEEIIELVKIVKEYGGIYATHVRDEGTNLMGGIEEAMLEAIRIAEEADVPVQIAHLKAAGTLGQGKSEAVTKIFEEARARGVKLYADQYPYPAGSTNISAIVLDRWIKAGGNWVKRLSDPAEIDKIKDAITKRIERATGADAIMISHSPKNPEWNGKTLQDVSEILELTPTEAAIEILKKGDPSVIVFMMDPAEVEYFMQKPYVMTSSDGMNVPYGLGLPHPRNYGAFTRKIREYVLNKNVVTMEFAIRAATSLPAEILGLDDRGWIKEGYVADILVFNPETIRDKATWQEPHQYSEGVEYLLINGELAIENGEYAGTLPGKPIRLKTAE
jgi:N-acyl-D-amino-acid deacylase